MRFIDLALSRRSVRRFTDRPVEDTLIAELIEAARWAPSAGNCQPWHFYIVKDSELRARIADEVYPGAWLRGAPVVLVVCAEPGETAERYGDRGRLLYCYQDTAAAVQNILLCAHDNGLSACWCGAFDEAACARVLGLSASRRPVAMIPIGYSDSNPPARPRKDVRDISTTL